MYRPNNMYFNGSYLPNPRDQYLMYNQPPDQLPNRKRPYNKSYSFGHAQSFSEEHWCETCDRGFRTQQLLEDHKKQHQKCNIDGCQFIAHPKVIIKHVQMQHSTGLYKKIAKLNNPEEIQKWREDRKKKYPTKSNIEKKNLEIKEKIERGEKMGIGYERKCRDKQMSLKKKNPFDRHNSQKQDMRKKEFSTKDTKEKQFVPRKNAKIISISVESRKLKPFSGLQHLHKENIDKEAVPETCTDLIEDDEFIIEDKEEILLKAEPVLCGALTSLINDYGSSDEEETKNTHNAENKSNLQSCNKIPIHIESKCEQKPISNNDTSQTNIIEDDDSGPEEIKISKEAGTNNNEIAETNMKSHKHIPKEKYQSKKIVKPTFKRKIPSTLLEKLLSNEIRQERNIVLQCIRYIVKNNYLNGIK